MLGPELRQQREWLFSGQGVAPRPQFGRILTPRCAACQDERMLESMGAMHGANSWDFRIGLGPESRFSEMPTSQMAECRFSNAIRLLHPPAECVLLPPDTERFVHRYCSCWFPRGAAGKVPSQWQLHVDSDLKIDALCSLSRCPTFASNRGNAGKDRKP